ncbi:protein kinase [Cedratvirus kamchatka]|uniref:Protein kinase n=1 Tax=Cedratvirus kamchatka TaxID=2716914 RepID=A0A6G8MY05_9VIRU|nr:protein kinase [Cedratvirus kamchatka]
MEFSSVLSSAYDVVFRATLTDGSTCIVKVLRENGERKGQEFRIMEALQGKVRIPRLLGYSEDLNILGGNFRKLLPSRFTYAEIIVMEDIKGKCLNEEMVFPEEERRMIASQMINLNEAMYEAGYCHGDLHPQNFIWDGENLTLIDFGSSYGIEFYQGINLETFVPTYQHAKTFCKEPPSDLFLEEVAFDRQANLNDVYYYIYDCMRSVKEGRMESFEDLRALI